MKLFLLLPLGCGWLYAVAALLCKRAAAFGLGPWRIVFVSNMTMGLMFQPLWFVVGGTSAPGVGARWYQPVVAGGLFIVGQIFTFVALERGDVSIVTPVLGSKVLFVAVFTGWVLGLAVPAVWWLAAVLTAASIYLLARGGGGVRRGVAVSPLLAMLSAGVSAVSFALTDVLVQCWAPGWGVGRFVPLMFTVVAAGSLGFIPFFHGPLSGVSTDAWRWLLTGCALLAAQALGMAWSIGHFGSVTAINVVYSSRGLWSVLLVWMVGARLGNREGELGGRVLLTRLAGSALLVAAIALVFAR